MTESTTCPIFSRAAAASRAAPMQDWSALSPSGASSIRPTRSRPGSAPTSVKKGLSARAGVVPLQGVGPADHVERRGRVGHVVSQNALDRAPFPVGHQTAAPARG